MELIKSNWQADENRVSLSMPISKVDKKTRHVSGFATLDNVDRTDDVVTAEASQKAFARFRGNIREMHQPIAAGRMVDFKEESFYDTATKKFYRGIYVTAYISEGAEDTWKKVLDGTLSGFSIGGNIIDQSTEFSKDDGRAVRFIKEYDLVELSLVDSPANQLSNIFSVVKTDTGTMFKGMLAETELVNTFWCETDEIAKNSASETEECLSCGNAMVNIGFVEKSEDEAVKTAALVTDFLRQKEDAVNTTENGEGGVNMTDEITKSDEVTEETPEGVISDAAVTGENEAPGEVTPEEEQGVAVAAEGNEDNAVEGVDETPAEPDFEKLIDGLKDSVKESIQKAVEGVENRVSEATQAFDTKASEFEKSLGELSEELKSIKEQREEVAKRLEALEGATAFKKSGEVETAPEKKVQKGVWGGALFSRED